MSEKNSITLDFPNKLLRYELKEYLEHNFNVYIRKENQDLVVYGKPENLTLCQEQVDYFKSVDSQCLLLLNEFSKEALNILSLKLFIQSKCKVLYTIESNILYIYGQLYNSTQTYNYLCNYNNIFNKNIELDFSETKNDSLKSICKELEIKIPIDLSVKSKIFIYFILKYRFDLFNKFDEFMGNVSSKLIVHPGNSNNSEHNLFEKLQKIEEPKNLIIESQNKISNVINFESAPMKVFRTVIIDGGNVAHEHGNQKFSFMGIKYAVDYFVSRGHKKVYALLSRRWQRFGGEVFEQLEFSGYLKYTPSRVINNVRETPHDDRLILDAAVATNGIVLSNDQYREHMVIEKYKNVISNRLIAFTFFDDHIIIPNDPFGPGGPSLDDILVLNREEFQHRNGIINMKIDKNQSSSSPTKKSTNNRVVSNQIFKQESNLKGKQLELYQQIIEVFPDHSILIRNIINSNPEIDDIYRLVNLLMVATNNK